MTKRVISVGFAFPGGLAEFVSLDSKKSLLDADVVIFRPAIGPYYHLEVFNSQYQGLPSLSDTASFQIKAAKNHWLQQIKFALQAGTTVIVFMPAPEKAWVDSGQRSYSGTGRNRHTTRHVESFSTISMLPAFTTEVIASEGTTMQLTERGKRIAEYWNEFGGDSTYRAVFEGLKVTPLLTAGGGSVAVGCEFSLQGAKGRVIILPSLTAYDHDPTDFGGQPQWTKSDKVFGQRLFKALLRLAEATRLDRTLTPPPEWEARDEFGLERERELRRAILEVDTRVDAALNEKSSLSKELADEGELRRLLYETGPALEKAILSALQILGFSAEPFKNAESEFDAVFTSLEGRFLGEAEGKDNKAISIDKLRQLEMNVQEDFARDEISDYARAALFGNAFRLKPPNERPEAWFSEKCVKAAERSGTVLVRTVDLFFAAKRVKEKKDMAYAAACRQALLCQCGKVVKFPEVLVDDETDSNNEQTALEHTNSS